MNPLTKIIATFGLFAFICSSASANTYRHIDQLAQRIDRDAKRLVSESRHYRDTPEYGDLVADARDLCRLADHMHDVARHEGDLAHLEADLIQLDAMFRHLETVFDCIEERAARGYGRIHGNTAHVKRLLNSIADNIHHLYEDIQSLRRPVCAVPPVAARRPVYTTPPNTWGYGSPSHRYQSHYRGSSHHSGYQGSYGAPGRGITIGGGSSRFTIRF